MHWRVRRLSPCTKVRESEAALVVIDLTLQSYCDMLALPKLLAFRIFALFDTAFEACVRMAALL